MKREPRPAIHMEKQLGWVLMLRGAESLGISKVGQTVLARLMESQIWHQLASSVWGGLQNGQWPLFALITRHFNFSLYAMGPFKMLPQCWN